jgi:photosystem II stability/assembly factor-like uncharacterized protein
MKKFYLLAFAIIVSSGVYAQERTTSQAPQWAELIKDGHIPYEEIVQMHNDWWEGREVTKGCGWKPFKRWESLMQSRLNEDGKPMSGEQLQRKWHDVQQIQGQRSPAGNWSPLGPILNDVTTRADINGVGRVNCLAFHPNNAQVIFVGTPAGGLWRSYDAGASWESNTDGLMTLGVSSIAFDPSDPNTIYIGTGDRDAADSPGMGVMKSVNGGDSWEFINTGMESLTVGSLIVKSDETNVLIAGTNDGIFRSSNSGDSWQFVSADAADYRTLLVKPGNSDVMYATASGKFFRSEDSGQNWQWITGGLFGSQRMVIAVTEANPEVVYVCAAGNDYGFQRFYRSLDGGVTFDPMADEPNILGWAADGSSPGGQGWYDLCMAADPLDENTIYVGGIRMKKSSDGGATWIDINPGYLHVDQHECMFSPHNGDLYLANDGGFYHYEDNNDWKDISDGIVNAQIYRMGQSPHTGAKALTGFQDNGTSQFNGAQWMRVGGGDGFECWYDNTDENWRYGSLYYGRIYRTSPDFTNQQICGQDVLGVTEAGAWYTPFILSDFTPDNMFVGMKNVWRSTNIKHPIKDSIVWDKISNNLGGNNTWNMVALVQSRSNENVIYCSQGNARIFRSTNALDEEVEWANLSSGLPLFIDPVVAIETHPTDENIIYISYSDKVYRTEDGAENWIDYSEGLPDIPINDLVYDLTTDEGMYAGTDMGIYYRDATMSEWIPFSQNFPLSVRVTELEIFYGETIATSRLRASTYGRGLWESDLFDTSTYSFPATAMVSLASDEPEVYANFEADVKFFKNLGAVDVTGFSADDVYVDNGTLNDVTGGPLDYILDITPTTFGPVKIFIEDQAAVDLDMVNTYESDTLLLMYNPEPELFGIYGPGGVGDDQSMAIWLRADKGVFLGSNEMETTGTMDTWQDLSGEGVDAIQSTNDAMPIWLQANEGINGMPAVYFDGEDDYLMASGVRPGQNVSIFSMVEGDDIQFNTHGWIASSRMPNGFVIHPWENQSQYSAVIIDNEEEYASGPLEYIGDAAAQHMYGVVYEQTAYYQLFNTLFDERKISWGGADIGDRDEDAVVDVKYGWDFDERFGQGKIAEHFIYNRRVHESHRTIIANYMAAKYGIDLGAFKRYSHWTKNYDVAGIGQESFYDLHLDAQGTGVVRMNAPSDAGDGEYLMWGSDNAELEFIADGFPILSSRLERSWGVEETGDMGTVTFMIEESAVPDLGLPIGLIVGNTSEFEIAQALDFYPLTLENGMYTCQVDFPSNGVFTIGAEPEVGVEEFSERAIAIFPNPASNQLTIDLAQTGVAKFAIEMFDVTGRVVYSEQVIGNQTVISVSSLATGNYAIKLTSDKGTIVKELMKF